MGGSYPYDGSVRSGFNDFEGLGVRRGGERSSRRARAGYGCLVPVSMEPGAYERSTRRNFPKVSWHYAAMVRSARQSRALMCHRCVQVPSRPRRASRPPSPRADASSSTRSARRQKHHAPARLALKPAVVPTQSAAGTRQVIARGCFRALFMTSGSLRERPTNSDAVREALDGGSPCWAAPVGALVGRARVVRARWRGRVLALRRAAAGVSSRRRLGRTRP